ncbi:ATP/GTP-binding protein [Algimonas arctica]|uniref:ATP/GTP-binding protein n=1 Tax=Algimonas arctica TaxID=1479486 RepID=A0A8J3CQN4_9PROT|nr:ATP/GTP-binding protein [Algimonas arctica]GHA86457.1 ATP/GTP-binding protein [Algimonas arctica]
MTRTLIALFASVAIVSCGEAEPKSETATDSAQEQSQTVAPAQPLALTELWVLDGFNAPESVIAAGDGTTLYVSNVGGEGSAKDGNGVISKIGLDGRMIARTWVSGTDALPLHAPKGMALIGDTLAVTDIDHVVMIDVPTGEITARIPIDGAAFLNDAAVGPNGTVLISDSGTAKIHMIDNGVASLWLEDARLNGINGLQLDGNRLLVTTMTAGELLSVDWTTKAITGLASGMDNADGIGLHSDGNYIISSWPGQLWHVRDGETPTLLQNTSGDNAVLMNDILLSGDTLVTPNWLPGTVRGYRLVTGE